MLCRCIGVVFVLSDSTEVGGDGGVVSSLFASDIPHGKSCVQFCSFSLVYSDLDDGTNKTTVEGTVIQ